jgi:hypothetical protein
MVVKLKMGASIRGALSYNEQKLSNGKAQLLMASGFGCDIDRLGFTEKLRRFQLLNRRDRNIRTNTVHLSINFPPEEILSDEKMREIAVDYMTRIGFAEQPFLVYRHTDTHHQHFHIVTTSIQADGNHIVLNNLGRDKSEPARKAIERSFGLIQAECRKSKKFDLTSTLWFRPAEYGKMETKLAITNIVGSVVNSYKFASLEEFNVILRQFNVIADRGLPGSRLHTTGGLVYKLLDSDGRKIGVPIKASDIYKKPMLAQLEKKFPGNQVKKAGLLAKVQNSVLTTLHTCQTAAELALRLKKRGILLHFDRDKHGIVQSVHFIDQYNKVVFSNRDLGISLEEMFQFNLMESKQMPSRPGQRISSEATGERVRDAPDFSGLGTLSTAGVMHILFRQEYGNPGPDSDMPKKKKKRKKGPSI